MAGTTQNQLLLSGRGMDLKATLFCGQTFSWREQDKDQYIGAVGNQVVKASQEGDTLCLNHLDGQAFTQQEQQFWQDYFALDMDYAVIQKKFVRHSVLAKCVQANPGIRVLRQPFFDCLLSFIISQNNHIPRIVGISQRLRVGFGTEIAKGEYAFPTAKALSAFAPEDLEEIRSGFRAKYLISAAQMVASEQVSEAAICQLDNDKAREHLCQIFGVGPKVADCVLLFSFGRWDIVPMDVWMKRALEQYFKGDMPGCSRGYQGIAQQYIFHWARQQAKVISP